MGEFPKAETVGESLVDCILFEKHRQFQGRHPVEGTRGVSRMLMYRPLRKKVDWTLIRLVW
jgi:hypothetical protein